MNMQSELSQEQLIQICNRIILTDVQTIADNKWCFNLLYMPMPLVYQSFILEFTKPYFDNITYRNGIHTVCSEIYQSCQN